MHDPKLIEVVGNAYDLEEQAISVDEWNTDPAAARARCATAALTALCTLHPDVAAILSGEAVAVPREATRAMLNAGLGAYINWRAAKEAECLDDREVAGIWKDMLAAAPRAGGGDA